MKRLWTTWFQFGICLVLVLAAMARISVLAISLDNAQAEDEQHDRRVELVLQADGRTTSILVPIQGRESARSQWDYYPFYPAQHAYTRLFSTIREGDVLIPSLLLADTPSGVLLHFQIEPHGELTSPQVPHGNMRDLAEARYTDAERIKLFAERLRVVKRLLNLDIVRSLLAFKQQRSFPAQPQPNASVGLNRPDENGASASADQQVRQVATTPQPGHPSGGESRSVSSYALQQRKALVTPIVVHGQLFLVREWHRDNQLYIQGVWINWPLLRLRLLHSVRDLLPNADLILRNTQEFVQPSSMLRPLTSIREIKLAAGEIAVDARSSFSPIRIALLFTWVCVIMAAGAVSMLLHAQLMLSERRAAFVSAVTHELRTPLTTFRMYTEMLASDMVPDKEKRARYLETLQVEADRLGHLVENVLAFARLERGRHSAHLRTITVDRLLDQVKERLEQRSEQAGMHLVLNAGGPQEKLRVMIDAGAVEQILFNLVDNACKYASRATDRRIEIEAVENGKFVSLRVRDHGSGIDAQGRQKLFRPFSKSASDAAHSEPGIGLGLSLCRRLARSIGGNLHFDAGVTDGACFVLNLPKPTAR